MYETHFGFSDLPFKLTPDPRFHVDTAPLRAALRAMRGELDAGRAFVPLVAGSGLGKTTVARRLLREFAQARHHAGELQGLSVEGDAFFRRVAESLAVPGFDAVHPLGSLMQALEGLAGQARKAVLLVDEAQHLDVECLKRLRKLTAVQAGGRAALQVCLVGRAPPPGLDELARIGRPVELGGFIGLAPLDAAGTRAYVLARLARAGWAGRPTLDEEAVAEIYDRTGGNPSQVNRLCGHVLLQLFIQRRDDMSADVVRAVADLQEAEFEARSPPALDLPARASRPAPRPIEPPRPAPPDPDADAAEALASQLVVERDVDIDLPLGAADADADAGADDAVPSEAADAPVVGAWRGARRLRLAPGLALLAALVLGGAAWQAISGRATPGGLALRYAPAPASAVAMALAGRAAPAAAPPALETLAQQAIERAPTAAGSAVDRATADRATADRATADRATADRATADRATADRPASAGPASAGPPAASAPVAAVAVARPRGGSRPRTVVPVASTCGLEGETLGLCTRPGEAAPAREAASAPAARCDPGRAGMGRCSVR